MITLKSDSGDLIQIKMDVVDLSLHVPSIEQFRQDIAKAKANSTTVDLKWTGTLEFRISPADVI